MTKEVLHCPGQYNERIVLNSCEECNDQSECQGHTTYIVKFLPLIINDISNKKVK